MRLYVFILLIFIITKSFSQNSNSFSLGIEESNSFYDYGIFCKYDFNLTSVQYKLAYSKDEFAIGKKLNGYGIATGIEYNIQLDYSENHPYYALGFSYHNYNINSVHDDEMRTYSFHYNSNNFSVINGIGYIWNIKSMSISGLVAFQINKKYQNFSNIKNIWHSPVVEQISTLDYSKRKYSVLPLLNIGIGYVF